MNNKFNIGDTFVLNRCAGIIALNNRHNMSENTIFNNRFVCHVTGIKQARNVLQYDAITNVKQESGSSYQQELTFTENFIEDNQVFASYKTGYEFNHPEYGEMTIAYIIVNYCNTDIIYEAKTKDNRLICSFTEQEILNCVAIKEQNAKEFDSVVTVNLEKDCHRLKELLHQRDCAIERVIDENKMLSNRNQSLKERNHNLRKRHRELIDELKRAIGYDKQE